MLMLFFRTLQLYIHLPHTIFTQTSLHKRCKAILIRDSGLLLSARFPDDQFKSFASE